MDAGSQRSNLGRDSKVGFWILPEKHGSDFQKNRNIQKMATCVFFLLIPHVQSPAFSKRKVTGYIYIYMCKHRLRTLLRNLRSTFKNQWKSIIPHFSTFFYFTFGKNHHGYGWHTWNHHRGFAAYGFAGPLGTSLTLEWSCLGCPGVVSQPPLVAQQKTVGWLVALRLGWVLQQYHQYGA